MTNSRSGYCIGPFEDQGERPKAFDGCDGRFRESSQGSKHDQVGDEVVSTTSTRRNLTRCPYALICCLDDAHICSSTEQSFITTITLTNFIHSQNPSGTNHDVALLRLTACFILYPFKRTRLNSMIYIDICFSVLSHIVF